MKKLIMLILILEFATKLFSQVPNSPKYSPLLNTVIWPEQSVITDIKDCPVVNSSYFTSVGPAELQYLIIENDLVRQLNNEIPALIKSRILAKIKSISLIQSNRYDRLNKHFHINMQDKWSQKNKMISRPASSDLISIPGFDLSGIRQKLDSVITEEFAQWVPGWLVNYRQVISLNDSGRITKQFIQQMNQENQQLLTVSKYESTYDADQTKIINTTQYAWNVDQYALLPVSRREFEYLDGNQTGFIFFTWNIGQGNWQKQNKTELTFNTDNTIKSELTLKWDTVEQEWIISAIKEYAYDINGQLIELLSKNWRTDLNDWINSGRTIYDYTNTGKRVLEIISVWKEELNDYVFISRNNWSYNDADNLLESSKTLWNTDLSQWQMVSRQLLEYNDSNQQTYYYSYNWSADSMKILPERKIEFIYVGPLLSQSYNNLWNAQENRWDPSQRVDYYYNKNSDLDYTISNSWIRNGWKKSAMTEFTHDSLGRITILLNYLWDGYEWMVYGKSEFAYDGEIRVKTEVSTWDLLAGNWGTSEIKKYSYSELGFLKREVTSNYYMWAENIDWYMTEYSFNKNGLVDSLFFWYNGEETGNSFLEVFIGLLYNDKNHITEFCISFWDEDQKDYAKYEKGMFTYNENDKLTTRLEMEWDKEENSWIILFRDSIVYDAKNYQLKRIGQAWYPEINDWVNVSIDEYSYDEKGREIKSVGSYWIAEINEWYPVGKTEYEYNDLNKLTQEISSWSDPDEKFLWFPFEKILYSYDEFGAVAEKNIYHYLMEEWQHMSKESYTYDHSFPRNEILIPYDTGFNSIRELDFDYDFSIAMDGKIMSITQSYFNFETNDLTETRIMNFFYSGIQSLYERPEVYREGVLVYPNPASVKLFVSINDYEMNDAKVKIYDLNGRVHLIQTLAEGNFIDIESLRDGIYIIQLKTTKAVFTQKFIKSNPWIY